MTDPVLPEQTSPLAEGRWLFRRLYVFAVSAGLWVLLMRTVGRTPAEMLPRITDGLMGLLAAQAIAQLFCYPVSVWMARRQKAWDPRHDIAATVLAVLGAALALTLHRDVVVAALLV